MTLDALTENAIYHNAVIEIDSATYRITKGGPGEPRSWYLTAEQAHEPCTYRQWPASQAIEVAELLSLISAHGPAQVIDGTETGSPTVR